MAPALAALIHQRGCLCMPVIWWIWVFLAVGFAFGWMAHGQLGRNLEDDDDDDSAPPPTEPPSR